MKDKLAKQQHNANNAAATTTKMTTEKKGENKAGAASTPPSPPPPPVAVVIKGGKNATTSLSPTGTLRGYWQAEEETALRAAVQKHGIGAWEKMRTDPDFKALRCAWYIFYRERRATAFRVSFKLYSSFSFSFSRASSSCLFFARVLVRDTEKANFDEISSNVLGAFFSKQQQFLLSFFFLCLLSSPSSRLSKKIVFRDGEEEVKEEESCCCCVFECGSFRWLGDLVVVVVKVESSSVASNLSKNNI